MDYQELQRAHQEASAAYREYGAWQTLMNEDVECNHPGPMTKLGKRDRRHRCGACIDDYYSAQQKSNNLYFEYGQLWDLFERIGMPLTVG